MSSKRAATRALIRLYSNRQNEPFENELTGIYPFVDKSSHHTFWHEKDYLLDRYHYWWELDLWTSPRKMFSLLNTSLERHHQLIWNAIASASPKLPSRWPFNLPFTTRRMSLTFSALKKNHLHVISFLHLNRIPFRITTIKWSSLRLLLTSSRQMLAVSA